MGAAIVTVDWSITIGNLLTMFMVLIAGLVAFFNMRTDVRLLAAAMDRVKSRLEDFKDVMTRLVEQNQRIDHLERLVDEMRSGQGFKFDLVENMLSRHRVEPNKRGKE
jgi:hypothetical protein